MGIDPLALGNHKLNTSCLATLAADLSVAFDAQVTYGYTADEEPYEAVVLGIAGEGKARQLKLWDNDYFHTERAPGEEDGLQYDCYHFDDGTRCNTTMWIYKDCFETTFYFIGRWFWYHSTFTGEHDDWEHMLAYRRKIQEEIMLMGGDTAVIHPDSSYHQLMHPDPYIEAFSTIVANIKTQPNFLDVSAWLRNDDAPFPDNPLLFLDDFSYWPTAEQMVARARRAGKLLPKTR